MAKLTNTPQNLAAKAANIPVPLAQPAGHVTQAVPRPFTVLPPIQGKTKAARRTGEAVTVAKTPRLKGEPWFLENFSGKASDIVQLRHYPSRREGFHCPPCGIAGCRGIVIRGKEGKGNPIEILKIDPQTREMVMDYTINGFIVGETCLKKYGHLDIKKVMSGGYATAEPAVPEPVVATEPVIEIPEGGEVEDDADKGIDAVL